MRPTEQAARAREAFGPYQLLKQLAVGGMAEIYLARATGVSGFEKLVALKMIHPNYAEDAHFIDMLVEEAKIVVHLTQPNIVQIFDLGRIGDVHYIAMEYVDGLDLYHVLRSITEVGELLDLDVAAYIALEVCAALDYAHRCRDQLGRPLGIIHRDISPQNILLSKAGEVKLADFGIAKASVRARQTAVGVIKGKYYYMSPEQAWGDTVDHRTDIFSTGVVLYESIVGQMLYLDEDLGVLLEKVRKADIAPPSVLRPEVPRALDEIVLRAVARRPEDRFQSAHEFQLALQKFLWTHAPHFNLGRVRAAVLRAVSLEDSKRVFDLGGHGSLVETSAAPSAPPPIDSLSVSFSSHSLLPAEVVRTGEKKLASLPSIPDWGDDFDGATMVSDPPLMLAHLHPNLTGSPEPPPILPISVDSFGPVGRMPQDVGWDGAEETTKQDRKSGASPPPSALPAASLPRRDELGPGQGVPPSPAGRPPPPVPGSAPPGAAGAQAAWPAPPYQGQAQQGGRAQMPGQADPARHPAPPAPQAGSPGWGGAGGAGPVAPGPPPPSYVHGAPRPGSPAVGPGAAGPPAFGGDPRVGSPWSSEHDADEADDTEQRMLAARRRRVRIVMIVGAAILTLLLVVIILAARKSLESPGSVQLESEPTGAKVFYRGRQVGVTPYRLDSLPVDEEHSVRLEHPRCESTPSRLNVEAGKTTTVRVRLRNCD